MRKLLLSFVMILLSTNWCIAQKMGFSSNFTSSQQIRNYFASNISLLDPIEGEYDVEFSGEYITPLVHQYLDRDNFKIWIVCNNNVFTIYMDGGGFRKSRLLKIQPVGETNVYTFYYDTTPTRIYLQNLNHFKASLHLNNSSANTFRGAASTAPSVNILPIYDCIKVYPTMSMYADVVRKHIEEDTKPTIWTGTGFALTNNYIVTNYHVVEEAKSISIQGINGLFNNKYGATVVATDKVNDLAILKVNGANISIANIPYSVRTSTADVGEEIFVLGYPLTSTMGDEIKLTTGVISSKSGFQGDVSLYQISAPIQPGNSGGPLFDSKGNVIGIVSAKHRGAENVGYAIKASYLRNLMESTITTNVLPQTNRISAQNLSSKVKAVKNFVYYIVCSSESNIMSNSGMPTSNGGTVSSNNTVNYPSVRSTTAERARIKSVKFASDYTAVEIISNNQSGSSYYQWCNINRNTYIMVNGTHHTMTKAEGIKIAPEKTYFSYAGQDITFTLYFPPIPTSATSMDLIESADSEWKFYGIKIR